MQDLNIVGDRLFNWDEYDVEQDWSTGYPVTTYLVNRETGERELIEYGSMTDLSRLSVLTGLKSLNIQNVGLTSLEGIQYLGSLEHLWVFNCADLTDASAAFTMQNLRELMINDCHGITSIEGVQNLMNLEHLELRSTDVESIAGVEALSKLRYFDLQYTLVTDLSPLGALSDDCEILFDMDGITVQDFLSLPDSVLAKVQRLCIAGDWIYNGNNWWFDADWSSNGTVGILQSSYSDQRTPIGQGSVADLSFLSRMPNLREFQFAFNPIESLDGIEALTQLEFVRIRLCPKITDVSLLFTMPSLYEIDVSNLPITSVAGIEALPHLVNLRLGSTQVTDLSPLAMLDTTEAALNWSGFNLSIDNLSDVLDPEQYQVLAAFPTFWNLNVFNTDCSLWLDAVRNVQICELHAGNCSFTPETLKQLVEQHPELTYIKLSWTTGLTDISALLTAPNLERVCVSNNMQEAIESLGEALPFGLDIE